MFMNSASGLQRLLALAVRPSNHSARFILSTSVNFSEIKESCHHIQLCTCSLPNLLKYEENFLTLRIIVRSGDQLSLKHLQVTQTWPNKSDSNPNFFLSWLSNTVCTVIILGHALSCTTLIKKEIKFS
jgi:hypothetical protein